MNKRRSVKDALANTTWLADLQRGLTEQMIDELANMATLLDDVELQHDQPDETVWHFSKDGTYSAKSAYLLQFEGATFFDGYHLVWGAWATAKCRFFVWTALLGKVLTVDDLLRCKRVNNYFCPLCMRNLETTFHLLVDCSWSRHIWGTIATRTSLPSLDLATWNDDSDLNSWLSNRCSLATTDRRKATLTVLHLVRWEI
ncbi:hypothetical protein D1007_20607 [Hordeum vulgare]|nr:hypothetical protein D1007_20607 [Hordeum vulgare]